MKVIILTGDEAIQAALCHKLKPHCDIKAIILSENVPRKSPPASRQLRLLVNRVAGRLIGSPFVTAWRQLQQSYKELYPSFPDAPIIRVKNVNDAATIHAIEETSPDLIIVSGTNLVGRKIIEMASNRMGVVNLHTGISPYVKGGPNCTNWCLAEMSFHLIGNTVMWLDAGIDTGNILATEQTPLTGHETLSELHWKVMEHAHSLYVKAVCKLAKGEPVPAIPQDSIGAGKTFYTINWGGWAMLKARLNFKRHYSSYFANTGRQRVQASGLTLHPISEV
jgi:folate-dependent phosphoribosylglycinamide formyltransferase PurN